jgi:hypothetical protein
VNRRARGSAAFAGLAFALAGCTFLVKFDEPPTDDAALSLPDARTKNDASDPDADSADTFVPPNDTGVKGDGAPDYEKACVGHQDGKYCNGNQIVVAGGSPNDLISCTGGQTVRVKPCTAGCVPMPGGSPDECNECTGKTTGNYCGDDFYDWHPDNKNKKIRCENGLITEKTACTTCSGTGPNATCP